jgi:hypothetical protein
MKPLYWVIIAVAITIVLSVILYQKNKKKAAEKLAKEKAEKEKNSVPTPAQLGLNVKTPEELLARGIPFVNPTPLPLPSMDIEPKREDDTPEIVFSKK